MNNHDDSTIIHGIFKYDISLGLLMQSKLGITIAKMRIETKGRKTNRGEKLASVAFKPKKQHRTHILDIAKFKQKISRTVQTVKFPAKSHKLEVGI